MKERSLVKAHIIPEAFFSILNTSEKTTGSDIKLWTLAPYSQRRPVGIYDPNILCKDCDSSIGIYDDCGSKFLLHSRHFKCHEQNNCYEVNISNKEYVKLKKFFVSVLWRSSITSQFNKFTIDKKFTDLAKKYVMNHGCDDFNIFPVILKKFVPSRYDQHPKKKTLHKLVLEPIMVKYNELNFCLFVFGGFQIFIKIDNEKIDIRDKHYFLNDSGKFFIDEIDFDSSQEYKNLANVMKKQRKYVRPSADST